MYILTNTDHKMEFYSKTAGTKLVLFYRTPTEDERFGYENGQIKRSKGKVVNRLGRVRRQYGLAIITGLGEDCFGKPKGGKVVPISSDKDSEHYDPDWKKYLAKYAMELVEALAQRVFEDPVIALAPEETDDDSEEDDTPAPLPSEEEAEELNRSVDPEDAEGN